MGTSAGTLAPGKAVNAQQASLLDGKLKDSRAGKWGVLIFGVVLACGLGYIAFKLVGDLSLTHEATAFPYVLLGLALLIALGFEFVNGFHDTATPSPLSFTRTRWSRISRWCGRGSGISSVC